MGGFVTGSTTFGLLFAGVHDGFEEGACGEYDGSGAIESAAGNANPGHSPVLCFKGVDHFLSECEIFLLLDPVFHFELVGFFVRLGAQDCAWLALCWH